MQAVADKRILFQIEILLSWTEDTLKYFVYYDQV